MNNARNIAVIGSAVQACRLRFPGAPAFQHSVSMWTQIKHARSIVPICASVAEVFSKCVGHENATYVQCLRRSTEFGGRILPSFLQAFTLKRSLQVLS
jgi:hypothetical protein